MKIITTAFFLLLLLSLSAQDRIIGNYRDNFGNSIKLNIDSTFDYSWSFDMSASWTKGIWKLRNDTVFLHILKIYDTLNQTNNEGLIVDTLILSTNETSERITLNENIITRLHASGQNEKVIPDRFLFKKGRLIKIENGRLIKKKRKGFRGNKKLEPWYFKIDG